MRNTSFAVNPGFNRTTTGVDQAPMRILVLDRSLETLEKIASTLSLIGKSVRRDLMQNPDDWNAWTDIAGDVAASLQQTISIKSKNQRLLCLRAEVFAAPDSPTRLQAMLAL